MKHHLDQQALFQMLAEHFNIPGDGRWVMHLDIPHTPGSGYTADVEFERYDPHKHRALRNAPPLLRLLPGGA